MKTKTLLLTMLFLISSLAYCQVDKTQVLQGSWMGKVSLKDRSFRALFRFDVKDGSIKGFLDGPDNGLKDIPVKAWTINDSL